jgi:uncharacterized protein YjiS (DUF1127 family)
MIVLDIDEVTTTSNPDTRASRGTGFGRLGAFWTRLIRSIEDRRTLHQLYQLDARILRDMGFDPEAIYNAREGAIGERDGHRYRGL